MTTCEIQNRILYLEGQIKVIQKNNGIIKKNIADLEESGGIYPCLKVGKNTF